MCNGIYESEQVEDGLIILEWKIEEEFEKHEFCSMFNFLQTFLKQNNFPTFLDPKGHGPISSKMSQKMKD